MLVTCGDGNLVKHMFTCTIEYLYVIFYCVFVMYESGLFANICFIAKECGLIITVLESLLLKSHGWRWLDSLGFLRCPVQVGHGFDGSGFLWRKKTGLLGHQMPHRCSGFPLELFWGLGFCGACGFHDGMELGLKSLLWISSQLQVPQATIHSLLKAEHSDFQSTWSHTNSLDCHRFE